MLRSRRPHSKKSRKPEDAIETVVEPIDVFVDAIIGFLEKPVTYLRMVGNQAFALLSAEVKESTVDLMLAVSCGVFESR
jgi:DNA polymerase phi